jgi:hypothetical protein
MSTDKNKTHNLFIKKSKVTKDGDIQRAILFYLTQEKLYKDYKVLSVSICEHSREDYLMVIVVDEIEESE